MKTSLITAILLLLTQFRFAQSATQEQGDFWMEISRPIDEGVFALVIDAELNLIAGMGNFNGVYLTNDNGESWMQIGLDGIAVFSLHIHQNGNIFAGTDGFNSLYRMESIEDEWVPLISGIGNVISIMNVSSGDLFIGGWTGIYKSPDFGETWEQVLEAESGGWVVNAIIENSDGILFAGVTDYFGGGGVYRSLDNGATWQQVGLINKFISSLAINSNGMLFAGSRGSYDYSGSGVFLSEDIGSTWAQVAFSRVTSLAIDPNDVIYAGCENVGVIRSLDNGESWELIASGMGDYPDVDGLSLSPDGYLYAYSRWSLHRSVETVFTPNTILLQETIDIKIFPNPFIDFLNIVLPNALPDCSLTNITIYDILGNSVLNQKFYNQNSFTVNLSSLNAGFYYVIIETNGQRFSKPIIKQ